MNSTTARRRVPGRLAFRLRAGVAVAVAALVSAGIIAASGWATPPAASPAAAAGEASRGASSGAAGQGLSEGTPVWTWSNGQYLSPVMVNEEQASQRPLDSIGGIVTRARAPGSVMGTGVLPDGTVIGQRESDIVAMKGDSLRTLATLPGINNPVILDGTHVYVLSSVDDTCTIHEVSMGGGSTRLGSIPAEACYGGLITDSRIYWQQGVGPETSVGPGLSRVVSRALSGGPVRVEAQNAKDPVLTALGIVVQTLAPMEEPFLQSSVTGIGLVKEGKGLEPLLNFHGWTDGVGIESVYMQTTGNGNLLTIASASTAGLLVIDLSTRKSWNIVREQKDLAVFVYNSGTRIVWNWFAPFLHGKTVPQDGRAGVLVFTPPTGSLEFLRGARGVGASGASGDATAWFVPDPGAPPASEGISDGSDSPDGTYVATVGGLG